MRLSAGSKASVSQAVPPPPASHHLPAGSQVLAARAIDASSNGLRGIARHGEPAPRLLAGVRVIRGDVAAHPVFGPAVADDHLALEHPRRAGDRVGARAIDDRVLLPELAAGRRVERDQPAVVRRDEDLALPERDAAVDHVAAALVAVGAIDLRIERPQALAGARVNRVHDAPGGGDVHDAVDHERRRLDPARGLEVVRPDESEVLDVARVDLPEPAEPRLGVVEPVARPVPGGGGVRSDVRAVDLLRRRGGVRRAALGGCLRLGDRQCAGTYEHRARTQQVPERHGGLLPAISPTAAPRDGARGGKDSAHTCGSSVRRQAVEFPGRPVATGRDRPSGFRHEPCDAARLSRPAMRKTSSVRRRPAPDAAPWQRSCYLSSRTARMRNFSSSAGRREDT